MSAPLSPSDTAVPPGSGGLTAQQALVAAAAMRAAASAPNPVDVLAWTAGQTASIAANTATWAKNAILGLWATVNPYDKRQVEKFAATAAGYMGSAQAAVGRVAAAAQVRQLASIGITVDGIPSLQIDVRAPAVAIRNGKAILLHHAVDVAYADGDTITIAPAEMTTEALFMRPAAGFRWAQSQGRADAAEISQARIESLVDDNLMLAQRLASAEVLAQAVDLDRRKPNRRGPRVTGYRRVIHPELSHGGTCGMCIVAADQIYHVSELMPIHARCKCTIAAITADHDPGDDLNQADLKKLYKDAGGTSAAHLKRTRYKRDNHGELGPVLVPKKPYKPRDKSKQAAAAATAVTGKTETKAEIAARHLPGMEKSLADLRTRGLSEDDQRVVWHKQEIAKLQADLEVQVANQPSGQVRVTRTETPKSAPGTVGNEPPKLPPTGGQSVQAGDEPPRKGQVDRSGVAHVYQHELDAADKLAELGEDVKFIPRPQTGRDADIEIRGERWEIKSPTSSNGNTIVKRLGRGVGQSSNLIFNLLRTPISIEEAVSMAREAMRKYSGIDAIRLIGRDTPDGPLDLVIGR